MIRPLGQNDRLPEPAQAAVEPLGEERKGRVIQSVDRALTIIETLAGVTEPMSLGDIAAQVGLNASTCHHLIATLVERGYVVNAGRGRGYLLSSRIQELAEVSERKSDIVDFVRQDLVELSGALGLGVQLAVMQDFALITKFKVNVAEVHVVEADEMVKMRAAHATATGKAILAWLPESTIVKVISENGMERFTENTITGLSELMEDLRWVRRNGYAVDNEELKPGVVCYGAALRDEKGAVVASISASFPAKLASEAYRRHVMLSVTQCARKLSDRLKVNRY